MATSTVDKNVRKRILNLKNISTCSLAVFCFFFCSSPQIAYSTLRLASDASLYDKKVFLFHLWSCTFTSMNSTFNCLIFFWRNSILRREGLKIVNAVRPRLFWLNLYCNYAQCVVFILNLSLYLSYYTIGVFCCTLILWKLSSCTIITWCSNFQNGNALIMNVLPCSLKHNVLASSCLYLLTFANWRFIINSCRYD